MRKIKSFVSCWHKLVWYASLQENVNYIFEGEKEKGVEESDPKPWGKHKWEHSKKKKQATQTYTSIRLFKKVKLYWDLTILGFGCFHRWETLYSKVSRYRKALFEQDELFSVSHTAVVLFTMQRDKIIASLIRFERPAMSKPCGSSWRPPSPASQPFSYTSGDIHVGQAGAAVCLSKSPQRRIWILCSSCHKSTFEDRERTEQLEDRTLPTLSCYGKQ